MRIKLSELVGNASRRPPGYVEDVLAQGKVSGDFVYLGRVAYARLCAKYRQVGDAVAMVAKPVARVVDRIAGTRLSSCGGCAKRQERLNGMFRR
jgi:hypothetical protein